MPSVLRKLTAILAMPAYRRLAGGLAAAYLVLFMIALQDVALGGQGWQLLTTDWTRMFERTGTVTFEPIAQITVPGLTVLLSPLNLLIALGVSLLAGVNLTVTYIAFRQPKACTFNRSAGILASVPALAGSACCAPVIVLILGLQVSSLLVTVFQVLIPASVILLLGTLKLILDRTNPDVIVDPSTRARTSTPVPEHP